MNAEADRGAMAAPTEVVPFARVDSSAVFNHHLYEYKRGLRKLILHTAHARQEVKIVERLERAGIAWTVQRVNQRKLNVFFGDERCVAVIRAFGRKSLAEFTPEEDFILGTLLGYDGLHQCVRFLRKRRAPAEREEDGATG